MSQPLLELKQVSRNVGGLTILHNISLELMESEILGLIGPNGAGKTSLFNAISGQAPADSGLIKLATRPIHALKVDARARAGLARSFQTSRLFPELSLLENISMAVRLRQGSGYRWWRKHVWLERSYAQARELLRDSCLSKKTEQAANTLSYGEQRILDVLICLAQQPRVLLLDEPTAGLSQAEAETVMALVQQSRQACSIMLISHDIDTVMRHCDRVAVLSQGRLLICASPQEVARNQEAQKAYLGTELTTQGTL